MDEQLNQEGVFQRVCDLAFVRKQIVFVDSEGSQIEKLITEVFSTMQVSGLDDQGATYERTFRPPRHGDSRGWETIDKKLFSENAERIVKEMNQVRAADECPKEDRSVILLPNIMYL